ncbi:MAG: spore coat protein [Solirubrobacterales bacterium]
MSFLDMFIGDDDKLSSEDIAKDMIKDSKFSVTSLAAASAEAVNPELRQMLTQQLDKASREHFQLTDILLNKGWYHAYDEPIEQIKTEYQEMQNFK